MAATYLAVDGLVAGLRPGAVVCDTSTVAPATVRGLAPVVAQPGATLIDTPVSGSVSVVESGTITVMVGGEPEALDRARPVLDAFAKSIFHLGDVGAGATMKLVVNSLVHSLNVAVSEALVLAEKAGLDRATVYDIFEAGAAGAPFVKYKRAAFLQPGKVRWRSASLLSPRTRSSSTTWRSKRERAWIRPRRADTWSRRQ